MNKEMIRQLTAAKADKSMVALYRDDLSEVIDYTGFPVLVGSQLVVLARENDFQLDGYVALRLSDITFMEQVDDNGFIKRLLQGEKLYERVTAPKLVGVESLHSLISGVQGSFGGWLTVEALSEDEIGFFMGVISHVDSNFLYLWQVDAQGEKHQEETTVPLQDIVTVTFGGRYVETYRKYVK